MEENNSDDEDNILQINAGKNISQFFQKPSKVILLLGTLGNFRVKKERVIY